MALRSGRNRSLNMSRARDNLWSIVIFLFGFYMRGIIDFHSMVTLRNNPSYNNYVQSISKYMAVGSNENALGRQPQFQYDYNGDTGTDRTHWCVIAMKYLPKTTRGHFDHFPHASEIILPCWSYFVKENVVDRCGFALAGESFSLPPWIKQLVQAMGCKVEHSMGGVLKNGTATFVPVDDIQYIPNFYLLRPRLDYFKYLDHPDHAHMLRRLFVDDNLIAGSKGNGKPYQIGFIQREGARRIDNLERIYWIMRKEIPEANVTITDFQFDTVKEQASWFATKDVIIGAHGAAMTNSIFITPGTIVMQLYPPGYFLPTLESLIEQSGGVALQWYEKGVNPYVKTYNINARNHTEFEELGQSGGFSPDVTEVVAQVQCALGVRVPAVPFMKALFKEHL